MSHNTRYPFTPYRIEHRPTFGPHSRDELLAMLDLLAECGVKAWWTSVAAKGSYPLFESRFLPFRDDAVDYFPWLVEQAHQRDIALFSWEYLTTAPMLADQHPDWRWRFFDWDGPQIERDKHYVCWNSPYGDLLKEYCVEVVAELGLDGIWFDGSFMHGHGASGRFACCCDFCRQKYRDQTGRDLPGTIDLRDIACREYMEWRYADHTRYWRDLSGHVREHDPDAIIVYNYFNRLGCNIESGSPLRRMAADAPQWPDEKPHGPMEGMISAEVGVVPHQNMLLAKILRAVNDNYPVELWGYAMDTPDLRIPTANPNPSPLLLHAALNATAGAFSSFGCGLDALEGYRPALQTLTGQLDPVAAYLGGEPLATVGLVVSGCTKDYGYIDDQHPLGQSAEAWNSVHGMHNLLNSLHRPSEVLLDNMLSESFLSRFDAVVLPEVRCLSAPASQALSRFVESGGTVLAIGQNGLFDPLGRPHDRPLLDDLFDITWRDEKETFVDITFNGFDEPVPPAYRLPGPSRLVRSDDAEVLATGRYNAAAGRTFTPQGIRLPDQQIVDGAAVLRRSVGQGQAILIVPNIAAAYGRYGPNAISRALIEQLLAHLPRRFTADAPPNVAFGLFEKDGRTILHILNVPAELLTLGLVENHLHAPVPAMPQDALPVGPVRVTVPGAWQQAFCPTPDSQPVIEQTDAAVCITIDRLSRHAMIVLDPQSS